MSHSSAKRRQNDGPNGRRPFPLRLVGHRGASSEFPENTLEAFERALELGVDVLETDIHLTADGHVVVSHDPTGERAANVPTAIAEARLAEVQSWDAGWAYLDPSGERPFAGRGLFIPTLNQLLDLTGQTLLNIDIKHHSSTMVATLLALLRDRGVEEQVTLASFDDNTIAQVRAMGYRGPTALQLREVVALWSLPAALARRVIRGQAVQVPTRRGPVVLSSCAFIDKCHALGLRVDYWTINDGVEADVLLERGADGIMTDDPSGMAAVVNRHRGRRAGSGQ